MSAPSEMKFDEEKAGRIQSLDKYTGAVEVTTADDGINRETGIFGKVGIFF